MGVQKLSKRTLPSLISSLSFSYEEDAAQLLSLRRRPPMQSTSLPPKQINITGAPPPQAISRTPMKTQSQSLLAHENLLQTPVAQNELPSNGFFGSIMNTNGPPYYYYDYSNLNNAENADNVHILNTNTTNNSGNTFLLSGGAFNSIVQGFDFGSAQTQTGLASISGNFSHNLLSPIGAVSFDFLKSP